MKYCITKEPDNTWSLCKVSDDDKDYFYCKDGTFSWSKYHADCPRRACWKSLDSLINSFIKQYNSGDFDILLSI